MIDPEVRGAGMTGWRVAALLMMVSTLAGACTGFAVYADEAWYGMNFDYPPDFPLRFDTGSNGVGNGLISMSFYREMWMPTVGMNGNGIFATLQYQCPMSEGVDIPDQGEIFIHQLYMLALGYCSSLSAVEGFIDSLDLVNLPDLTLHTLIADPTGEALIAESGDVADRISRIDGDWLVLTNFRNADFTETRPENIEGVGAERYRRALDYIGDHHEDFGLNDALAVLETAVETDEIWSTKASMVYRPSEMALYFCIDSDFGHVWKISMDDHVIETYSGFEEQRSQDIQEDGITSDELRTWF